MGRTGRIVIVALLLIGSASVGCKTDWAVIETQGPLTIDPCSDGKARVFAPVYRMEANLLQLVGSTPVGQIEMRSGFRVRTVSDDALLVIDDVPAVKNALQADPATVFPIDGKRIKLALSPGETCPDATQSLVALNGTLSFGSFDTHDWGIIKGSATFDLVDGRTLDDPVPTVLAAGVSLQFEMEIRNGINFEDFAR